MVSRKTSYGFTLIEILLSLSIFSIVLLSLYGSFWAGMRINAQTQEGRYAYRSIAWVFQEMSNELQQAVAYTSDQGFSGFQGSSNEITFLFPSSEGLRQIRYFLKPQEQTLFHQRTLDQRPHLDLKDHWQDHQALSMHVLCREEELFLKADTMSLGQDTEIVALGIVEGGFLLSYAYIDGQEEPRIVWRDHWDEDFIPASIKVILKFNDLENADHIQTIEKIVYIPTGFWGEDE